MNASGEACFQALPEMVAPHAGINQDHHGTEFHEGKADGQEILSRTKHDNSSHSLRRMPARHTAQMHIGCCKTRVRKRSDDGDVKSGPAVGARSPALKGRWEAMLWCIVLL